MKRLLQKAFMMLLIPNTAPAPKPIGAGCFCVGRVLFVSVLEKMLTPAALLRRLCGSLGEARQCILSRHASGAPRRLILLICVELQM